MIRIAQTTPAIPAGDDYEYEPAAEWLGGEAWVSPPPFTFEASMCALEACGEQAAADWIPV